MKFSELQQEVSKYIYSEDDGMIRIALASIVATRMKLGKPVWMVLIGPSSSGKSQILRPLALSDEKFIRRVDDLTENTLLSGAKVKTGERNISLLNQIGERGIIVISDLTVIFSKSDESRSAILSQLRMVYDGEMTKYSGNQSKPISWKGYLGIIAGSTPSVYRHFEDVADMGERFIYYRMKDYDVEKATRCSLERKLDNEELDDKLAGFYSNYIKSVVDDGKLRPIISAEVYNRIIKISMLAELLRSPVHYDRYEKTIDRIPVPAMPMRVALQLMGVARGLALMSYRETGNWELSEEDLTCLDWCAYSLANEERRACLRVLASIPQDTVVQTQVVADKIGLSTSIVGISLQHLAAVGIVKRTGSGDGLCWEIKDEEVWKTIRRLEEITTVAEAGKRQITLEDGDNNDAIDEAFRQM